MLAAALVGCGGVENESTLAEAAERTEAQGTGRFELKGVQDDRGEPEDISCTGEADYAAKSVHVTCDFAEGKVEMIAIGRDIYTRASGALASLSTDEWWKDSDDLDEESLGNLSPEYLLGMLRAASSETQRLGEEDVRGEPTVRYRLTVECEKADLECEGESSVDVWIGDDGIVRRVAADDESGEWTFEFFDFGADITIEAPPAELVAKTFGEGAASSVTITNDSGDTGVVNCADGDATPISQRHLMAALKRNGFAMHDDGNSCIVSNARGVSNDVLAREGIVHCSIHAEPPADAPKSVTRSGADGADAELALENVECTIFTDSPKGEEKIDRLEAAFAELERAMHP